MIKAQKGICCP